jgi:integration host factor subunit alpha
MTLTKADMAKSLMEKIRLKKPRKEDQQLLFPELDYTVLTRRRATNLVDAMFEIMKRMLEKGEQVRISGFGKFQVKFKWARKGRNPQTGDPIILKSRRVVAFHYSPKLKEKINTGAPLKSSHAGKNSTPVPATGSMGQTGLFED